MKKNLLRILANGAKVAGLVLPLSVSLIGCGRGTMVYPSPAPPAPATTTTSAPASAPVTIIDGRNNLPSGFLNQSVNGGSATIALDGETATSTSILLETEPQVNTSGGFGGNGVGNRALLGAINYNGTSLATMSTIAFNGQVTSTGSASLSVLLLVDLNCDGTTTAVLETYGPALAASTTPISGSSFLTYNASFAQNIWQASGGSIVNSSGTLVPSNSTSSTASLTALIAASPNICIINQASGDPGLPNGFATAGILFSLGSQSTTDFNSAFINSITIGTDTYTSAQWNSQ